MVDKMTYYDEIKVVTVDDPTRLDLIRSPGSLSPPASLRSFITELQEVIRTVRLLFADDLERRRQLFGQLHLTADTGLRGPDHNVDAGWDNLLEAKHNVAAEFPTVRSRMWGRYLVALVSISGVLGPIGAVIYYLSIVGGFGVPQPKDGVFVVSVVLGIAACWIPVGAALGIFLEFIFRIGDDVSYAQLQSLNPGRWSPFQRIVNTVVTAYCFAGLMGLGVFQVGVANILLNDFASSKPFLTLGIGVITGLSYPYVRDIIHRFKPTVVSQSVPASSAEGRT
jgi:hypothetical protein